MILEFALVNARTGKGMARTLLLIAMMMFFAVLALDIAVPAVVLSTMALAKWGLPAAFPPYRQLGEAA